MARFMRLDTYNCLLDLGLLPLFYQADRDTAIEIAAACARGGARLVEFTNRGEMAYQVFGELVRHFAKADPGMILGVGTVSDAPTAALFIAAGANFVVGPNFNPDVARLCNRRKIPYVPGCATPNEIAQAEELGVEIIKVFPGDVLGPNFVKAMLGPSPWSRLLVSGGVEPTEASIGSWFRAGAAAVGMGTKLVTAEALKTRDFDVISGLVTQSLALIRAARQR